MWRRCRLKHLPLKTVCQTYLEKNRCLHTHSVCLAPRGCRKHDREHMPTLPNLTSEQNVTQAAEPQKTQQDTRMIYSTDPVVLKYTNTMNDMKTPMVREKINVTNFGSIRFDQENTPTVHGQFDHECELERQGSEGVNDIMPEVLMDSSGVSIEEKIHSADESINDLYFLNDTDSSHISGKNYNDEHVFQKACFRYQGSISAEVKEAEPPVKESVNNMYFLNDSDSSHVSEMNYIDEQVFDDAYTKYQSSGLPDSKEAELVKRESKIQHIPEDDTAIQGLNYIDDIYFSSSFRTWTENKKSSVEFSDIKSEIEASLISSETQKISEQKIGKLKKEDQAFLSPDVVDAPKEVHYGSEDEAVVWRAQETRKDKRTIAEPASTSAFDYIVKRRIEDHNEKHNITSGDGSKKSYKKVLSLLNVKKKEETTKYEMLKILRSSIIYDKCDVIGLYKPYGLVMHPGTDSAYHTLSDFLPDLATFLKAEKVYPIHRLDATTTGVLLLARTPAMADTLKGMLKDRQLKKTYWTITKGIPKPPQGVIDIPIAEGLIDGRRRMVLKPDIKGLKSTSSKSQYAVTSYKVLSRRFNTALVECHPMTGVKHQLRVHLGFGLSCPVLGDHKYSHLRKLAPQRLPGDTLDHLGLKQSQVRKLPLFLHSHSVIIPELADGRDVIIRAKLPAFFNKALELLHLNRKQSQIINQQLSTVKQS